MYLCNPQNSCQNHANLTPHTYCSSAHHSRRPGGGFCGILFWLQSEVLPVLTPELHGVLRAICPVAAMHVVGRAKLLTTPADALGMSGMSGNLVFHTTEVPVSVRLKLVVPAGVSPATSGFRDRRSER